MNQVLAVTPSERKQGPLLARALVLASGMLGVTTLQANDAQTLLLFPEATAVHRTRELAEIDVDRNELDVGINVFASQDLGPWRAMGEVFVSNDEQEVERAQLGWMFGPESIAWVGRFHNPLGFWNTECHHGSYLQTSIGRPAILEYEDKGGVLPTHLTGAIVEGIFEQRSSAWHYVLAAGAGPELDEHLEPFDVLRPAARRHEPGATVRLSYPPDADLHDELGAYVGQTRIPAPDTDIAQRVVGAFLNWRFTELRVRTEVLYVENRLASSSSMNGAFVAGYLQVEQPWRAWTGYARAEGTRGADDDAYLAYFPSFVRERGLVGLRYELTQRQTVKLEVSRNQLADADYTQFALQWAAVFP